MNAPRAGLLLLCVPSLGCAWLEYADPREPPDPQLHGAGARDIEVRDIAVGPNLEGPAFTPVAVPAVRTSPHAELVSFSAGPVWASDIALPGRPLVLHLDDLVATVRVSGLGGERVWFGATERNATIEGGFGRTFRFFTGSNGPEIGEGHPTAVARFTLPVESPSAENLAIGERSSDGRALVWRVVAPVERTAAFAVFEVLDPADLHIRLTSANPDG